MWSRDSSAFVPSSVTVRPLTVTWPEEMSSSAWRREATPARAIIFWRRSSIQFDSSLRLRTYSLTENAVRSECCGYDWSEEVAPAEAARAVSESSEADFPLAVGGADSPVLVAEAAASPLVALASSG